MMFPKVYPEYDAIYIEHLAVISCYKNHRLAKADGPLDNTTEETPGIFGNAGRQQLSIANTRARSVVKNWQTRFEFGSGVCVASDQTASEFPLSAGHFALVSLSGNCAFVVQQ